MDSLDIQGKKYISSKRAHELTGYAKDYIGQLARGGKVHGTRVGRAWYVDEQELLAFAGLPQPQASALEASTRVQRAAVKENTLSSVALLVSQLKANPLKTWGALSYLDDEEPLLPPLAKSTLSSAETVKLTKVFSPEITNEKLAIPATPVIRKVTSVTDGMVLPRAPKIVAKPAVAMPRKSPYNLFPLVTAGVTLALLLLVIGGPLNPAEWSFSASQTASAVGGSDDVNAVLQLYFSDLFGQGIDLIRNFILLIMDSFSQFLKTGLDFIVQLLHLG